MWCASAPAKCVSYSSLGSAYQQMGKVFQLPSNGLLSPACPEAYVLSLRTGVRPPAGLTASTARSEGSPGCSALCQLPTIPPANGAQMHDTNFTQAGEISHNRADQILQREFSLSLGNAQATQGRTDVLLTAGWPQKDNTNVLVFIRDSLRH